MPGTLFWGLVKRDSATLLLLAASGAYVVDANRRIEKVPLPKSIDSVSGNDAKVDRRGALWLGQVRSGPDRTDGSLVRVSGGRTQTVLSDLGIPNGPAFSGDAGTLYAVNSSARWVRSFALDEQNAANNPRTILSATETEGQPDGLTVDANGRILVAMFGGGAVLCLEPSGKRMEQLIVPAAEPTSCTFGGPRLDTLFVTMARGSWPHDRRNPGSSVADPALPSLFALAMPAPGVLEPDLAETTLSPEAVTP